MDSRNEAADLLCTSHISRLFSLQGTRSCLFTVHVWQMHPKHIPVKTPRSVTGFVRFDSRLSNVMLLEWGHGIKAGDRQETLVFCVCRLLSSFKLSDPNSIDCSEMA